MDQIEESTCIRFVEREAQEDYLVIESTNGGCSSKLGRVGGSQKITLGLNCFRIGIIMHELIHALGYTHMHNHIDRDQYVTIHWSNIDPEHVHNFKQVNLQKYGNFDTLYDYFSVMHYGTKAFATSNLTVVPVLSKFTGTIGQRVKLSKGDKKRINNMYSCVL